MTKVLMCICVLVGLSSLAVERTTITNRAELAQQMNARLQEMRNKLRESSIKINTDIEIRMRANQLAREQTEREMHCVICETACNVKRPDFEWEANKGVSLIYYASDLDGNYVKIDETGRIVKVASFDKIPELAYREKITALILERIRADPKECEEAKQRAARKFDEAEAKSKNVRKAK